MIRRVVRLRRGLLYAHLRHDLSTASRDSGAARGRPLPRAMPRNAATAPAAIPCRAPLRLKRGSRHSLLQQPVAGRRWCAKRVTATTRARPILTLLPSKHDDSFNALGSNVDCSGTSHGRCSNSRPAPPPRRMASGSRGTPMPSRYECHRQPALARSSGLVLKLSRRSKHSASDIQAVPQLVGLEQCRARLCQRPGHRQSACEAKGETPAFPVTTQCGLRGGGGRSSTTAFALSRQESRLEWRT